MATAPNYSAILKQAQAQSTKAIAPTIASLQSYKPTLKESYQNTLAQIKANQEAALTGARKGVSQTFEERGIYGGGVIPQALSQAEQPIYRQYAGEIGQAGTGYKTSLLDLASQIAGVRGGALQNAISNALSLYGTQYGGYQSALDRAAQERQAALDRASQQSGLAAYKKYLESLIPTPTKDTTKSTFKPITSYSITDIGGQKQSADVKYSPAPNLYEKAIQGYGNLYNRTKSNVLGIPSVISSFLNK
jgi:hypothetical protein